MIILDSPFVVITVLTLLFIIMVVLGVYFGIKSIKTASGTENSSFVSYSRIESEYDKLTRSRSARSVVYVSVLPECMIRLYSVSRAMQMTDKINTALQIKFDNTDIARYGDFDFLLLSPNPESVMQKNIEEFMELFHDILREYDGINSVDIRFGIFDTASTQVRFNTALKRAKQACTMAEKENILYCRWSNKRGKKFEKAVKIENSIEEEIDNNHFYFDYQPIIDAKTLRPIGAEVLSRLNSAEEGLLTPKQFLSAIDNVGIHEKFDYYIFEKNCRWISNDKQRREKYIYTINFSRVTLCDREFAQNIIRIVEKYGLKFSCIAIEILEDKSLTDEQRKALGDNISILRQKGAVVLMDDFGDGYTSFTDLAGIGVDIVKIDKKITQNALDETGFLVLKNIIRTAHDIGCKTVCEGTETAEQADIIIRAGCDYIQGYYFYRPMPVAQFEKLLSEQSDK